jgi:hypothetical protein
VEENINSCKIERTGIIIRLDTEAAILEIEGREVMVPIRKMSPDVRVADLVGWTGTTWSRKEG